MITEIKWDTYGRDSYLSGTDLRFVGHRVEFDNPLMSPSFSLKSWQSRTNYQSNRTHPQLPLLKRGKRYEIKLQAIVSPVDSLYVQVLFFDRLGVEIDFAVLKDKDWQFTYPEKAFTYQIDLVNAGCVHFSFDSLLLSEVEEDETQVDFSEWVVYLPRENADLHVLFLEPDTYSVEQLPVDVLETLGNVLFIGDKMAAEDCYLGQDYEKQVKDYLWYCDENGLTKMNFIGYGPVGNLAAVYYGAKFFGETYISEEMETSAFYREAIDIGKLNQIRERLKYGRTVYTYGQKVTKPTLVSGLFDSTKQLRMLPLVSSRGEQEDKCH